MNKLTIVQMLPDLETGGVEEDTLETADYLARNGHRSLVIASGGRMVPRLKKGGSTFVAWRVGEKSPATLQYYMPLRRLLVREKVDILHLRSRVPAWLGRLVTKSLPHNLRPGVVTTFHGTYSVNMGSAVMTKGDRVIAISDFILSHIHQHYKVPQDRVKLIHGGYDDRVFDPARVTPDQVNRLKTLWGLDEKSGPVIMLAARLTGWKGHELFIEALSRIKDAPFTALCVGDIEENPEYAVRLEGLAEEKGLSGRVCFVGHCHEMPVAFTLADVVVSASIEPEAFGRVAIEAQAMGTPVVATAHGGSLETVVPGKTGWLAPPDSVEAFSGALLEAVSREEERKKRGEQAKEHAKKNFTMEKMCQKTMDLYQSLAQLKKERQK